MTFKCNMSSYHILYKYAKPNASSFVVSLDRALNFCKKTVSIYFSRYTSILTLTEDIEITECYKFEFNDVVI